MPKRHSCDVCSVRGKTTTRLSFSVTEEQKILIRLGAQALNMSMAAFIRHAVAEYFERNS